MSDLDLFGGLDAGGDTFDAAAFEKFKERMKQAAAQLKALQKQEKRQKQTEDELIRILVKFIKTGKKRDILLLVIRLLEMNVPAGFIVSLLLISNPDIQQELKLNLLPAGDIDEKIEKDTNRDRFMTAEEACDYHLIDQVVEHMETKK
ncbi:ATP-dependent Clp protease proteolytic subunit [Patescibacteria group bacterium]|nr:ATP-dependent Clp protease proteolytic subunit [Patescibacteria group bacterium]